MLLRTSCSSSRTALGSCLAARAHISSRPLSLLLSRTHATAGMGDDGSSSSSVTAAGLAGQSCSLLGGCSSETPKVAAEQLPALMAALPAWQLAEDATSIRRCFVAKNFMAAIRFFTAVAELAEAEGHHPDLHLTGYRDVEVVLSTHAIGGLSMFDFITAAKLDQLPVDYSPKWLKAHQHVMQQTAAAAAAGPGTSP